MTAGASLLDLIGERTSSERAPAVRAFAEAFLRRLVRRRRDGDGLAPDALCGEIVGAVRVRLRARRGADRGARLHADARGARLRGAGLGGGDQHRGLAVPGRLGERRAARRAGSASTACCTRSSASSATPTARSRRCCTRARPRGASRSCTSTSTAGSTPEQLEGLEEALRERARRRPRARSRTSRRWPTAARRMVQLAGAGAARYADEEVDETVAFLEWLLHDNFIFLGYREYRFRDDAISVVPGSGLGILADDGALDVRASRCRSTRCRRTCASAALEGDLLIVSKTNRLSRVHRRVRMDYVGVRRISPDGRDRRRGADARPVHDQGLRRAREPDAAAAPQAAPDPALTRT